MDPLIASLSADDLPNEGLQYLSGVIGLDGVKKLLAACRGMTFYIPLKMPPAVYQNYIHEHYRQGENNVRPLAKTLHITERQVYRLLKQTRRPAPMAS